MEEPPKAVLEERAHEHLIVTLANVASIVHHLGLVCFECCDILWHLLMLLHANLRYLLVENGFVGGGVGFERILVRQDSAYVENQLLLNGVRILPDFESGRHQLILCELHAETASQLDSIWDALHSPRLSSPRAEHQSDELIVVRDHFVDRVVQMLVIGVWIVPDFYFGNRSLV